MEHPILQAQTLDGNTSRWRRVVAITFVLGIEGLFIAGIALGLQHQIIEALPQAIMAKIVEPQPTKPPPPPSQPQLITPKEAAIPPPVVNIAAPPAPAAIHAITTPHPVTAPPAPPAPTAAVGITSTHTIPPYPEIARRMGQQGAVTLHIAVDATGRIAGVSLMQSSGSKYLDNAAVDWVKSHWRYRPATKNGKPVPSETDAKIVFDLKNA